MGNRAAVRVSAGLTVQVIVVGALLVGSATPAFAARPAHSGGGGGGGGGGSTTTGFDVSYPQCGTTLPTSTAFGIVGVNGGVASNLNPCFGPSSSYPYSQSELYWAVSTSTGTSNLKTKALLYVNTGDPGNVYNGKVISDWPQSSNTSDPYPACSTTTVTLSSGTPTVGANSDGCAWQYGYNMAQADAASLTSAANAINAPISTVTVPTTPSSYPWWLDVETANTWQPDTTMNVADLQGMIAGLNAEGVPTSSVGVYSTSSQWGTITGGTATSAAGSLYKLANWIPGARTLRGAESNCKLTSFTGGHVTITQWTGTIDNDYAC